MVAIKYKESKEPINLKFVPPEQAIDLKKIGFNEKCWTWYNILDQDTRDCYSEERSPFRNSDEDWGAKCNDREPENICIPTFEQAFDWFEKHYEFSALYFPRSWSQEEPLRWSVCIQELDHPFCKYPFSTSDIEDDRQDDPYPTKDEAKLAVLKRMIFLANRDNK